MAMAEEVGQAGSILALALVEFLVYFSSAVEYLSMEQD